MNWEEDFDKEFVKDNGLVVEDSFLDPDGSVGPIKQFIRKVEQAAREDEREQANPSNSMGYKHDTWKAGDVLQGSGSKIQIVERLNSLVWTRDIMEKGVGPVSFAQEIEDLVTFGFKKDTGSTYTMSEEAMNKYKR
jgi:hypothetical protein